MPRFNPNPAAASFGFLQYPKGTYRVQISNPKGFSQTNTQKNTTSAGVRFAGTIISSPDQPDFIGKPHPVTLYLHTPGAENFSKGVEAAFLGCKTDTEFNAKYGDQELWWFDTDDASCGQGYHDMAGQVADIEYQEMTLNDKSEEQSGKSAWRVVEG